MKKQLKLWHGITLVALVAVVLFIIEPRISVRLGLFGTLIGELMLLGLAVGVALLFHGDLKTVFPIRKPKVSEVFGTLLFWFGTYQIAMMLTMVVAYFFTEEVAGVNQGLSEAFTSVNFIFSFLIVSISPAICEEAVFRGSFFNSVWNTFHKKWVTILVTAVVFGAFHASAVRFVPTFILGIAMGYLVFETNNMFCNMLFHAVNNAVPTVMLFAMEYYYKIAGTGGVAEMTESLMANGLPLYTVGIYMFYGCAGIVILYLGNHLLHLSYPGIDHRMFPPQKKRELIVLGIICGLLIVLGITLIMISVLRGDFGQIMQYIEPAV